MGKKDNAENGTEEKKKKVLTPEEREKKHQEHLKRLEDLKKNDPLQHDAILSFKDFQRLKGPKVTWKEYCLFMAGASSKWWNSRVNKPPKIGKELTPEQRKAKMDKLKAELARLEKQSSNAA